MFRHRAQRGSEVAFAVVGARYGRAAGYGPAHVVGDQLEESAPIAPAPRVKRVPDQFLVFSGAHKYDLLRAGARAWIIPKSSKKKSDCPIRRAKVTN